MAETKPFPQRGRFDRLSYAWAGGDRAITVLVNHSNRGPPQSFLPGLARKCWQNVDRVESDRWETDKLPLDLK